MAKFQSSVSINLFWLDLRDDGSGNHVQMRNQLYFYSLPISNVTTFLNFVLHHKSLSITWNMSQFYTTEAVISFCGQIFYPTNENVIVSFWVLSLLVRAHFV